MARSNIEWTRFVVNYFTGCDRLSPGCGNCWMMDLVPRLKAMGQPKFSNGTRFTVHPEVLPDLLKEMAYCFINSVSDTHHSLAPDDVNKQAFDLMGRAHYNQFQNLTKRPLRMLNFQRDFFPDGLPENVWAGTSVESNAYLGRVGLLKRVKAKVRFVSFEPLLGPIGDVDLSGISWAITGGESGPRRRHFDIEWVREIRDQCLQQGVAFFYKQGSSRFPGKDRQLDGRLWSEFPITLARQGTKTDGGFTHGPSRLPGEGWDPTLPDLPPFPLPTEPDEWGGAVEAH